MTLGNLIKDLKRCDPEATVYFDFGGFQPTKLDSYRGYYDQLALGFDKLFEPVKVKQLIMDLEDAIGKTFEGYKGGLFTMSSLTEVWVDNYGSCNGTKIKGVKDYEYKIIIETEYED